MASAVLSMALGEREAAAGLVTVAPRAEPSAWVSVRGADHDALDPAVILAAKSVEPLLGTPRSSERPDDAPPFEMRG